MNIITVVTDVSDSDCLTEIVQNQRHGLIFLKDHYLLMMQM